MYVSDPREDEMRYRPSQGIGAVAAPITGHPDPKDISTSFVARQSLSLYSSRRRFTRPTNGFSKKVENHPHALALYFIYYNFRRIRQTIRVTPAMRGGIADGVWSMEILNEPSSHVV